MGTSMTAQAAQSATQALFSSIDNTLSGLGNTFNGPAGLNVCQNKLDKAIDTLFASISSKNDTEIV